MSDTHVVVVEVVDFDEVVVFVVVVGIGHRRWISVGLWRPHFVVVGDCGVERGLRAVEVGTQTRTMDS